VLHHESAYGALAHSGGMGHQAHMSRAATKARARAPHHMRAWRKMRGMTLEALGELVGMSSQNLGRIERGEVPYTQDSLEVIAEALGCSVADILARDPGRSDQATQQAPQAVNVGIPPEVAESVLQWVYQRLDLPEDEAQLLARASVLVMQQTAETEASRGTPDLIRARIEMAFGMLHSTRQ
jgi:transcriptional regulator with XRE-family HTH domain